MTSVQPDKAALSKALGHAFLAHQVNQLEAQTISKNSNQQHDSRRAPLRRPVPGSGTFSRALVDGNSKVVQPKKGVLVDLNKPINANANLGVPPANRIVVDVSVLVHALDLVKKWCHNDSVYIIIPLEALNTLDLLKKGTSSLAVRARAASRLLEEQVGANSKVLVQADNAFEPWDSAGNQGGPSPQWMRRTLGCPMWEVKNSESVVLAVMDSITTPSLAGTSEDAAKYENRADGALVREWAERMHIPVFKVAERAPSDGNKELWRNPPPRRNNNSNNSNGGYSPRRGSTKRDHGMVEKPPAPEMKSGVVRLLARGESLAP